jgi:predicted Kef-type K+ transport protein
LAGGTEAVISLAGDVGAHWLRLILKETDASSRVLDEKLGLDDAFGLVKGGAEAPHSKWVGGDSVVRS